MLLSIIPQLFYSLLDTVHDLFGPSETIHIIMSLHMRGQVEDRLALLQHLMAVHYGCLNVPAIINERSNENVTLDTATFSFAI